MPIQCRRARSSAPQVVIAEARLGESVAIFHANRLETTPSAITIGNNLGVY